MDRFPSTLLLPMLISSLLALSAPVRATAEPPGGSVTAPRRPPRAAGAAGRPPAARPHRARPDRDDPYYWLRDDSRTDPEVLGYLEAENRYTERASRRWRAAGAAARRARRPPPAERRLGAV